jgi:hypothetical protein
LVNILQALSMLNISHDNITIDTVFVCKQSPSKTITFSELKLLDFSQMKTKSFLKRDRASVVLVLEFIIKKGSFKDPFIEQCACDIVNNILDGAEWEIVLQIFKKVEDGQKVTVQKPQIKSKSHGPKATNSSHVLKIWNENSKNIRFTITKERQVGTIYDKHAQDRTYKEKSVFLNKL